ncbi:MAG: AbrB/MazE/SpoVT family DNA-binding domain-containing protein [Gammaproteobacteria bacterium]|nr:AbrB/MazE/SpoVT family DNA-binding domain-containing protein [Gammaproteobacteria bacterium]MCL5801239.1 AbrB/MazE/SpoVT family DNA-binding domain-containing protein [Gammaproteobacteria bacterium]
MTYLKLSSKNQIVLPKEARAAMQVKAGDRVLVVVKGKVTILMPKPKSYMQALAGIGKGMYPKNHLKRERRAW